MQRLALCSVSFGLAVAAGACARQSQESERAVDSLAMVDARTPAVVDSVPRVDSVSPELAGGRTDTPSPTAKAPLTPTPEPMPERTAARRTTSPTPADTTPPPRPRVPSRPNDATPSIPLDRPTLEPAPSSDSPDTLVARLEREARALARTDGCASASGCRVAPLGARACGGPRTYIAYCALTTDSARLFRKLAELQRAEQAYNSRSGTMSICSMVTPPVPGYEGGRCTAGSGRPGPQ